MFHVSIRFCCLSINTAICLSQRCLRCGRKLYWYQFLNSICGIQNFPLQWERHPPKVNANHWMVRTLAVITEIYFFKNTYDNKEDREDQHSNTKRSTKFPSTQRWYLQTTMYKCRLQCVRHFSIWMNLKMNQFERDQMQKLYIEGPCHQEDDRYH